MQARGRIEEPDVDYRAEAVAVTIRVKQRSGSEDCPGNPDTPYLLRLDEPLGEHHLWTAGRDHPQSLRRPPRSCPVTFLTELGAAAVPCLPTAERE